MAARRFPDDVPLEEKERRRKALDDLQAEIAAEINGRLMGRTVEVLVVGQKKAKPGQGRGEHTIAAATGVYEEQRGVRT